jgi:hypothetical protein
VITSAAEFVRLRTSENPSEYGRAAHEEAPDSVWLEIIRDLPDMRVWVAHNRTVPLSVLQTLAEDSDARVRSAVADKRKITTALRERLAQDPDASVRARVANNAKCEPSILELLAQDPEEFVRVTAESKLRGLRDAL